MNDKELWNGETRHITLLAVDEGENPDPDADFPSMGCPLCEKGILTVGSTHTIEFPAGELAATNRGVQRFCHFTCDRCGFKILIPPSYDRGVFGLLHLGNRVSPRSYHTIEDEYARETSPLAKLLETLNLPTPLVRKFMTEWLGKHPEGV